MANSNVRFYKLNVLPNFEAKHKGIFVHVAGIMSKEKNGTLLMNTDRLTLSRWLENRHITEIASGLWFGGENGWELLSNETNSAAINAAIQTKIDTLNAGPYAQAEITTATDSSTLTIKGIKEDNGIIGIPDSENFNLNIAIDGVYNESTNKIATKSTVTTAIGTLDVQTPIQAVTFNTPENGGNTTLTFNGIKEVDGIISQGTSEGASTFIVGDAKLKIQIGSNEAGVFEVFSANAQSDGAIKLNEYVFTKDENNVISVITPTPVALNNKLVTEQDIANLNGAMHYKGALTGDGPWPSTVAAGDVYIVTTSFTHSGESNPFEVGDMIVFNSTSTSDYKVIQSNLTLGTGTGQIAKNVGDLTLNNMVIATDGGIKTIGITEAQLTDTDNNKRTLSINNGDADGGFHHAVTITDTFKVIGKDFSKSINITSNNRSIDIAANGNTGVMVDLVWNTTME